MGRHHPFCPHVRTIPAAIELVRHADEGRGELGLDECTAVVHYMGMNSTQLGPRPADPSTISFDRHCFAQDGVNVFWTVSQSALQSGPKRFDDEVSAVAYGRKCNRSVTRHEEPRMVRIAWR